MTHMIKHLSFGKDYPGIVNPLDGTDVTAPQGQPPPLPPHKYYRLPPPLCSDTGKICLETQRLIAGCRSMGYSSSRAAGLQHLFIRDKPWRCCPNAID